MNECKNCKKESRLSYCNDKCKRGFFAKQKQGEINEQLSKGVLNEDYVIFLWTGDKCQSINNKYIQLRFPDKTMEDYKKEFPKAKLICNKVQKARNVNSGQFMKTEEYRKKYSELMKGRSNPNTKDNTTETQRKQNSPFSKEFYRKNNPHLSEEELEQMVSERVEKMLENRLTTNQKEYWIQKGYSDDESTQLVRERQRTFTLEKCIKKYGEVEGLEVWKKRQRDWSEKMELMHKKGDFSKAASTISKTQIAFKKDVELLLEKEIEQEYTIRKDVDKIYYYDFKYENKIVEFNGDFWHANPLFYDENFVNRVNGKIAKDVWEYDKLKIVNAENKGFEVLVVWENEYLNSPQQTIKKCVNFLNTK